MATILSQLAKLRRNIYLPFEIRFVEREIKEEEFEENVIYVHITI